MTVTNSFVRGRCGPKSTVEWYTPPEIFTALGLSFDLDPSAPPGGVPWVPAKRSYSRADDGLSQKWQGRIWLNPPYGREISRWTERLSRHGNGMALVFARTDTPWFHGACQAATAVCFIAGRLRFHGLTGPADTTAPAPSVLLAYGLTCAVALANASLGQTLVVPQPVGRGRYEAA